MKHIAAISRAALGPDELAGEAIKRGTMIVIAPYVLHRHRALWTRPDHFDPSRFLDGAREAYRLIVTAFAARNRETLRPLLNDEVYSTFEAEMRGHEERSEIVNYAFVGFTDVRIVHAEMKGRDAEITVRFGAQFVSSTTGPSGAVTANSQAVAGLSEPT